MEATSFLCSQLNMQRNVALAHTWPFRFRTARFLIGLYTYESGHTCRTTSHRHAFQSKCYICSPATTLSRNYSIVTRRKVCATRNATTLEQKRPLARAMVCFHDCPHELAPLFPEDSPSLIDSSPYPLTEDSTTTSRDRKDSTTAFAPFTPWISLTKASTESPTYKDVPKHYAHG